MKEKYLFIGGIASEAQLLHMEAIYGKRPVFSSDPLQKSILMGMAAHIGDPIDVLNMVFYPTPRRFFSTTADVVHETYATFYNVPFLCGKIIQHFSKSRHLAKALKTHIKSDTFVHIVVYSAYFAFLKPLYKFKKKHKNIDICLVVPDLPQFIGLDSKRNLYKALSNKLRTRLFSKYNACVDSYVLLTEQMNAVINPTAKPSIVMEGVAPSEYVYHAFARTDIEPCVLYAGTLQLKYGIGTLLEAISLIPHPDMRFCFYGDGEGKAQILEAAKSDARIEYHASIGRYELNKIQQKARILVNPRQNTSAFTKYSFPSKNIEYLLSGRPVIAYKLDGIPDEYDALIYYPTDNSAQALADKILELFNETDAALETRGKKTREYVEKNKNYICQAERIIKLISNK